MKKAVELVATWGPAIAVAGIIVVLLSGCKSENSNDNVSAEFPTIERWWK